MVVHLKHALIDDRPRNPRAVGGLAGKRIKRIGVAVNSLDDPVALDGRTRVGEDFRILGTMGRVLPGTGRKGQAGEDRADKRSNRAKIRHKAKMSATRSNVYVSV